MGPLQTAYLSAGSNLGDRRGYLEQSLSALDRAGATPQRVSSYFETQPVGFADQPWFLNIALKVETRLSPQALLECCLRIEASGGRSRTFQGAPRTLDLDILLYGDLVVKQPPLIIPHPRMVERRFVLKPLAEIAPDVLHPVLNKKILTLLASCPDSSSVQLYRPGEQP